MEVVEVEIVSVSEIKWVDEVRLKKKKKRKWWKLIEGKEKSKRKESCNNLVSNTFPR